MQYQDLKLLIGGALETTLATRVIVSPTTGQPIAQAPEGGAAEAERALRAARAAQPAWGRMAPLARAVIMRRIADLIDRDSEALARIVVAEQGKPITEARGEVGGAAEFFRYFAEFARRIEGQILPSDAADEQVWIQRLPVGVVVGIIPWNYPAALVSRKVAPAMIAGDTIVLKPHELTPLSALYMARLFVEAGVPAGVINIVTGAGPVVGEALVASPLVDLVTMTGSVPTGQKILRTSADHIKPVSLELGGKAPFIVMPDADLDLAVKSALTSRFMNCGQVCICNERTLVHKDIYADFLEAFVAATRALRLGDPMSETTDVGPKVSAPELAKVEGFVAQAIGEGARLVLGGAKPKVAPVEGGNWYLPTILSDVRPDMAIMRAEIFGPVVPIAPFATFEDALAIANDSRYGLSAYLFTRDMPLIMRAVRDIDFGELYINRIGPEALQGFHVGYRQSGVGGDDGVAGLEIYLKKKTVYMNYGTGSPTPLMPY